MFIPPFQFVFEPGVRYAQVNIGLGLDGRITPKENFPMIIHVLQNGGKPNVKHGKIFIGLCIP
jgi:hypothetical protein